MCSTVTAYDFSELNNWWQLRGSTLLLDYIRISQSYKWYIALTFTLIESISKGINEIFQNAFYREMPNICPTNQRREIICVIDEHITFEKSNLSKTFSSLKPTYSDEFEGQVSPWSKSRWGYILSYCITVLQYFYFALQICNKTCCIHSEL